MAINRLKYFRVTNAETQTQTATAVGVTQPTYQRWETGKTEVPKSHLAKLAKHFKTTELELLGRHPPKEAAFYDDKALLDLQYYGECAVHFVGGGEPLVLSISEAAHAQAYRELQSDKRFIVIKDLGNRTVAIRRTAISEFYFSSEAYDTYGPDHNDYKLATLIQMPDARDWVIVEAIRDEEAAGGNYTSRFAKDDVERIRRQIMITDEQFGELVANGFIKPEDLAVERAARSAETDEILALTHTVTIQLSTGRRREIAHLDCNLFECIEPLIDIHHPYSDADEPNMIRLPYEGYHRTAFFNPNMLDYISFPTHKIEEDEVESYDDGLMEGDKANSTDSM
ncbi:DNA-binding XRE family transcriptional regulator [Pseudaminobacter salicylatoxidans]|uniref:DNA-binding XRE family transcriptional regulator n=1 Tax=Pseudaminobacter salicylatoxidans TaxID=93369 RepID=A0A316C976_PSESE|nr:helix-turn-helix transcriptional regulator [Pseudaminobacter salicylatoxidans]PWJ85713.1 DNA-binding XRE family transcriptional regulator [Pseudaminobacter salicylatoxidans]